MKLHYPQPNSGLLLFLLISIIVSVGLVQAHAAAPTTTTVSDVIYRADGTPAGGTLLISWPTYTSGDGKSVAAGTMNVKIGLGGLVTAALAPNQGATPAGTYYKVVLKLDDGTTSTEYWSIPVGASAKISAIRTAIAPASVAVQTVSRQYVDSTIGGKADDSVVLHKTGDEVISGVKQFGLSPLVPVPTASLAAVNKLYVDTTVSTSAGGFLQKNGDSMAGPLNLAADPVTNTQAANRHYVDLQTATVSANVGQKLNRQNDTPITMASLRFATQFSSIQDAISDAGTTGGVVIPSDYAGAAAFANPNGVAVLDLRQGAGAFNNGTVDVKQFGAIGDGVADDFAAIQAAIDYVCKPGAKWSVVHFPSGTYKVSKPLRVYRNNVTLVGDGRGASIVQMSANTGTPILFLAGATGTSSSNYLPMPTGPALASGSGPSLYLDGTKAQHGFDFGEMESMKYMNAAGAFTLEFFFKPEDISAGGQLLVSSGQTNSANWHSAFRISVNGGDGRIYARTDIGGTDREIYSAMGAVQNGVTAHIALVYDGTTLKLYINGQQSGNVISCGGTLVRKNYESVTVGYGMPGITPLGDAIATVAKGWIDSIRMTTNVQYAGNFTKPTAKLQFVWGQVALLNFDNPYDLFQGVTDAAQQTTWLAYHRPTAGANGGAVLSTVSIRDLGFTSGGVYLNNVVHAMLERVNITPIVRGLWMISNCYESSLTDVMVTGGMIGMALIQNAGVLEMRAPQLLNSHFPLIIHASSAHISDMWNQMGGDTETGVTVWGGGDGMQAVVFNQPLLNTEGGDPLKLTSVFDFTLADNVVINGGHTETSYAPVFTVYQNTKSISLIGHAVSAIRTPPASVIKIVNPPLRPLVVLNSTNSNIPWADQPQYVQFVKGGTFQNVSFSAIENFDAAISTAFRATLSGDVTSSALTNSNPGDHLSFLICQDAGGNHSFVWPTNMVGGMAVGKAASKCSAQTFLFDGTKAYATSSGVGDQ